MKSVAFGVSSPQCWSAQLERCESECRRDAIAVASSCHAQGQKFTDPEFPPSEQSLFGSGERPPAPSRLPWGVHWRRASVLCPMAGGWALDAPGDSRLVSGAAGDAAFLGAVALLRAAQRAPDELVVHHDLTAGVVGVRLFKDGEWTYEIVDDYLPCCSEGLAGGQTTAPSEVWIALLEKANAKLHGSYEAVQRSTELEALEDLTGGAVRKLGRRELAEPELARALAARQRLGCLHLAARHRERRGQEHACGLLSGHGYPVLEAEQPASGPPRCRLVNPWHRGGYRGRDRSAARPAGGDGEAEPSFEMEVADILQVFTEVIEARIPPPDWQCYRVTLSTDRPSYPLLSARNPTQCLLIASQPDRRWKRQDSYMNGLGLRVYRCRVRAPPSGRQGGRQDPKANPFEPLELLRRRPLGKTRSACLEFPLEPHALYVVSVDSQYRCPRCVLRFACSGAVQFRELSAPEAGHFLAAQPGAEPAVESAPGLQRSASEASSEFEGACARDGAVRRCGAGMGCEAPAPAGWWAFGCY